MAGRLLAEYLGSPLLESLDPFFELSLLSFKFLDLLFALCDPLIQLAQILHAALDSGLVFDEVLLVLRNFLVELP